MTDELPEEITLNLDTVERPGGPIKPFSAVVEGRRIVMTDPEDIDWQDLLEIEDPLDFLRHCVSDEDRTYLRGVKIPGWKFGVLMERYQKHYKLDEKIREAQRQQGTRRF